MTLMDERFRELNLYKVTETGADPDRNTFYEELYFDREVEGRNIRTKIYQGRVQSTTPVPLQNANGATQGSLLIEELC